MTAVDAAITDTETKLMYEHKIEEFHSDLIGTDPDAVTLIKEKFAELLEFVGKNRNVLRYIVSNSFLNIHWLLLRRFNDNVQSHL